MSEKNKIATKKVVVENELPTGVVVFTFANGVSKTVDLNEHSEAMRFRLGLFGITEKYGNAYAGVKGDVGAAIEAWDTIHEQLLAGEWEAEGAVGERPSLVVEAVIAALTKAGKAFDDATTRAKYTGPNTKKNRDAALKNPQVRAEFARLQAEAATKRAEEAMAAATAATAPGDVGSLA